MGEGLGVARVVPPGRIIKRELDARGWTQKTLAAIMGRPEQVISEIIRGRKGITPETALQLSGAFGTSPELWVNLEGEHRLHLARKAHSEAQIARRSRLYSLAPVSELMRRGWIKPVDSIDELEHEVCAFLEIESPDQQPQLGASFRQTQTREPEIGAQIAWIKRVRHLARAQRPAGFDRRQALARLPDLMAEARGAETVSQVPTLLHSLGVHFVIVPHLTHTYLDGAAFPLEGRPVVALTLRYDRIDSFWFTLLHELAHCLAGHPGLYLDNLEALDDSKVETEANQLARDWLIGSEAFDRFVSATRPFFSRARITAFAREQDRHPGIVLGRLHHEGEVPRRNLRGWLVKVKPYLKDWIDRPGPD